MTRRVGGVSQAPFDSLNLGVHVGDDAAAVAENRRRLADAIGMTPVRLVQVHGAQVLNLDAVKTGMDAPAPEADASVSTSPGRACEIQVADCLPVLFATRDGRAVGAAHAGWRGLAAGVLEATVRYLMAQTDCRAGDIEAWLGPCIGPRRFEVGVDVREAFAAANLAGLEAAFVPTDKPGKWLAGLSELARQRLSSAGLVHIQGNDGTPSWCTVENGSDFFSFRRDGRTGRMAAVIGLRG
ncbi:MAG: peptidoglycan editing factor PgeF [Burkholderiales bacterium]